MIESYDIFTGFITTYHICQITGKPKQVIKPVPLYPIPVAKHLFEHLIIDCVGSLPWSKVGSTFLLTLPCVEGVKHQTFLVHCLSCSESSGCHRKVPPDLEVPSWTMTGKKV